MGLLVPSLEMLLMLLMCFFFSLPRLGAQPSSAQEALDVLIQDYAFRAFVRPRTGVPFDGIPPSNLSGVHISAMRLRSGSLRTRGFKGFKEFTLYPGVIEQPYVERLVLVYQNLGNWSARYYPLPGYMYLAPVVSLLVYDASNLSGKHLTELDIMASGQPISVEFSDVILAPVGSVPKCVWFGLHGVVNFSNVVSGNRCSTVQQGHFSIVVKSPPPPPPPPPAPAPVSPQPSNVRPGPKHRDKEKKKDSKVWIIVGSVIGGLLLLSLLGILILWLRRYQQKKRMQKMERAAEVGEALHMASVGSTKAPAAMVTRTQPTLETEYMP